MYIKGHILKTDCGGYVELKYEYPISDLGGIHREKIASISIFEEEKHATVFDMKDDSLQNGLDAIFHYLEHVDESNGMATYPNEETEIPALFCFINNVNDMIIELLKKGFKLEMVVRPEQ